MSEHLNIAIVSTQQGWRGGEEQARQLALGLRTRGHKCTPVAVAGSEFARRMTAERFAVERYGGNGKGPRSVINLRHALRKLCPAVVHFNDSRAVTTGGLACLGLGIPLRVASRRVDFPIRSRWKYRLLADRVVCVSHAVARISERGGLTKDGLRVVHDGVDPARMNSGDRARGRAALNLADDQRLVLNVAALTEHKGHRYLLDALPKVLESHPEVIVAICGDGELNDSLQQQARELGLGERVHFLGYRDDIPDLMHACDQFVMSSIEEGLGTTVIDAMLARRPIVATQAGGIPELLQPAGSVDQSHAWMVPPADAEALATAINEALASPHIANEKVAQAELRARERFTSDAMVEATLAVYREALG